MSEIIDDLITNADVIAEHLGVTVKAVYRMAQTGQGPVQRIGRKYYSRVEWIDRYKRGEPGFWSATPHHNPEPYRNPFLKRVA
jgi:hypothetical protein